MEDGTVGLFGKGVLTSMYWAKKIGLLSTEDKQPILNMTSKKRAPANICKSCKIVEISYGGK